MVHGIGCRVWGVGCIGYGVGRECDPPKVPAFLTAKLNERFCTWKGLRLGLKN